MAVLFVDFAVLCASDGLFSLWEREGEGCLHRLFEFSLPIINTLNESQKSRNSFASDCNTAKCFDSKIENDNFMTVFIKLLHSFS